MGDKFTETKLQWLDQVTEDPDVVDLAFRVAHRISSKYYNRKMQKAWPSMATLAADLNRSSRRIQEAITNLIVRGHLAHKRGGPGRASEYVLKFHDKTKTSDQTEPTQDENVRSETGRKRPVNETQTGRFQQTDKTKMTRKTGRKRPANPIEEPIEEPSEKNISPKRALEIDFQAFWAVYPKRKSKAEAQKAFAKARKTVDQAILMAGVLRYSAERQGQDATYTKHPATWLNKQCWQDEPESRSPQPAGRPADAKARTGDKSRDLLRQAEEVAEDFTTTIDGYSR